MSEKYSEEKNVKCSLIGNDVYQKLDYVLLRLNGSYMAKKIFSGSFCSGFSKCNSKDCQLVTGKDGKIYSDPLDV